jgi:hypothetical protein
MFKVLPTKAAKTAATKVAASKTKVTDGDKKKKVTAKKQPVRIEVTQPVEEEEEMCAVGLWEKHAGMSPQNAKKETALQKRNRAAYIEREMSYRHNVLVRPKRNVVCKYTHVTKEEEMVWLIKFNEGLYKNNLKAQEEKEKKLTKEEEGLVEFLQELFTEEE